MAYSEEDFSPHDEESDEPQEDGNDPSDGLDLLVQQEQIPVGTPGGSKADLRRGAFVDGKRHEKGGEASSIPGEVPSGAHSVFSYTLLLARYLWSSTRGPDAVFGRLERAV
jgi:hypothetical protein